MRAINVVRLLPVFLVMLSGVGCDNQQDLVNSIKDEKVEIQKQLTEVTEKTDKLLAENESLQKGIADAKSAAAKVEDTIKQAKSAATAALTNAKKEASAAVAKAGADVKSKLASAEAATKKAVAAATGKLSAVQKQLAAANAKVAKLEADLKKAASAAGEEK